MDSKQKRERRSDTKIVKTVPLSWVLIGALVIIIAIGIAAFVIFNNRQKQPISPFNTQTDHRDSISDKVSSLMAVIDSDRWLNTFISGGELSSLRFMLVIGSIDGKEIDRDLGKLNLLDTFEAKEAVKSLIDRNSDEMPEIAYDGSSFRADAAPSLDMSRLDIRVISFPDLPKNNSFRPDLRRELTNIVKENSKGSSYGWAVTEVHRGRAVVTYALHLDVYDPELKVFLNNMDGSLIAVAPNYADTIRSNIEYDGDFEILTFRLPSPVQQNESLDRCIESFIKQHAD